MNFKKTSEAVTLAVSLSDMKAHLRVDFDDEDALITALIKAATNACEQYIERSVQSCEWTLTMDDFPSSDVFTLQNGPVISIDSFTYYDTSNVSQSMVDGTDYYKDFDSKTARVKTITGWPDVNDDRLNGVTLVYTAGFASVPDDIVAGIKMMVGHLYENRQDYIVGSTVYEIPFASKALWHPYRAYYDA